MHILISGEESVIFQNKEEDSVIWAFLKGGVSNLLNYKFQNQSNAQLNKENDTAIHKGLYMTTPFPPW